MRLVAVAALVNWLLVAVALLGVIQGPGLLRRLQRLVTTLVLALLATLLSAVWLLDRAFEAFSAATPVARVTTQPLAGDAFALTYEPADGGLAEARQVTLHGDQWALSGGVVKWRYWLAAWGVPSYHRPMRLSGQFASVTRQQAAASSVYALDPATDWVWEALYRAAPRLPFIEAAYGSSAYVYVEPNVVFEVAITPSGYLIKRRQP